MMEKETTKMTTETKSKHTPGPWRMIKWSGSINVSTPDNGFGTQPQWKIWDENWQGNPKTVRDEAIANAALIAAAPELLEHGKIAVSILRFFEQKRYLEACDVEVLRNLEATIQKAEGK